MSFLLFKNCCFCVDLRTGSFIIGYLTLFFRLGALIVSSLRLSISSKLHHHNIMEQDVAFHRLTSIISIMILVFEILLCIALVVGLHKRLDQHLEMFYVGSFAFLIVGIILFAAILLRYGKQIGAWAWAVVALEIVGMLISVYFLTVIRSYYYKMKAEAKDDQEELKARETANTYFARTKPVLLNLKP